MTQFTDRYYPTLCVRRAEMRAMRNLPAGEKQKMLPIVLLAPWLNSIKFENTLAVVAECVGDIPTIVDIDRYFKSDSDLPSREYWRMLLDSEVGHEKWVDLIKSRGNYIPTIQILGRTKQQIDFQVREFVELNRGIVFRFEMERGNDYDAAFSYISDLRGEDILCIFDFGYGYPTELTEMSVALLIERLINIDETLPFVVSGSSFPNDFSEYDNFAASRLIGSRLLYANLSRRYGNYSMFYGDWGSTKPRKYDGGGGTPLPRIDFPTKGRWIIARSKDDGWDFEEAAKRITRLPEWGDRPMVWGTGMIEKTAEGLPGGISTGPEAIACRVNIHLFLQNNFNSTEPTPPPRGKWIDPIGRA